ncbi:uncharacterized protein LOC133031689 [Cannabis sativa]|uniref:uncharacterized protein LOC133031689 n=1 Tax=Cannabis sativa TaxID=3483 RepID=UPI0029C9DFBB|nr:uncharacterized protein LOC133031689 [Cannabis sativa]
MGFEGQCFTWLNKRQGVAHVQERLDRYFCNQEWHSLYPSFKVINGDYIHSDHCPVVASLENVVRLKQQDNQRRFRFETHWLKDDECHDIVDQTWLAPDAPLDSQDSILDIFGRCADRLGAWNKCKFGSLPRLVRETQKQLDGLLSVTPPLVRMDEVKRLETKLNDLLSREECYWKLRSRADWLALSDRNTKYFHNKATGRKKKNAIVEMMTEDGRKLSLEEDIVSEIERYFGTVFSSASPSVQQVENGITHIEGRVSSEECEILVAPFTNDDVLCAVRAIGATKAPGPDGFHAIFFHKFWGTIGPRVSAVCLAILNGHQSVRKFNKSNVVLIPKVTNPSLVKEYRPISLCSVMYKIVAKAVSLRLKGTLSPLISSFQSAFVPGRAIHDNVMVGFELLHSLFKKNNGVRGFMALKLDMSKAYDRVEWSFLRAIMCKFGFPSRWVDLVMDCVTTPEYCFLVNGKPKGCVVPSRGLRQGCPLSPYLFLFCAEALSTMLRQAEVSGDLMGFRCSRYGPRVSHLFFADDSLIFGRANGGEAESIHRILQCYEQASGQQVNFDKSAITFSPNVLPADRTSVLGILGLGSVATHDKYLGLPTVIGRNKKRTFASICDKVQKRVRGWKRSFFSAGGREILIKAILQAVPNYLMSIFQLPVATCDQLRSIILQFWWGTKNDKRKIAWVKWENVCQPKSKGGLGFKDLRLFNQAMVAKQVWRLLHSPNSLAGRVLKCKYFPTTSILEAKDRQGSSHLWSSLMWGLELLQSGLRKVVGDGQSVNAFRDPWLPRPRTFRPISLAPGGTVMVSDLIGGQGSWDVGSLSRYFMQADIDIILGIPLRYGPCADRWCWHYTSNGCYSVKSGYAVALDMVSESNGSSSGDQAHWWNGLWNLRVPQKIKIFVWRMYFRALPTNSQLIKRKIPLQPLCHRCGEEMETSEHALVYCSSLRHLWLKLQLWKVLSRGRSASLAELLVYLFEVLDANRFTLLAMVWWWLWYDRNSVLFGKTQSRLDVIDVLAKEALEEFHGVGISCGGRVLGASDTGVARLGSGGGGGSCGLGRLRREGGGVVRPRWCVPGVGEFVLSVDAAVTPGRGFAGFGGVIRGADGVVWASWAVGAVGDLQVAVAELLALRVGLVWAKSLGFSLVRVESDSTVVTSWVNFPDNILMFKPIVEEIISLLAAVGGGSCCAISRDANGVAHALAKSVTSPIGVHLWTDACPRFITAPVTADLI